MDLKLAGFSPCLRDGFRVLFRHGSLWALVGGALVLSVIVRFTPLPFRMPGFFSLQAFAGIAQLTGTLMVVAFLVRESHRGLRGWWPVALPVSLTARTLGAWAAVALSLALLVVLQWLLVLLSGDLHADDGLHPEPVSLTPSYAAALVRAGAFTLVLLAWGQFLALGLGRAGGLLSLFVLVFAGFLLPDLAVRYPALLPIVGVLPDLASLSPLTNVDRPPGDLLVLLPYVPAHVAQILALTLVTLSIKRAYGRSIDQLEPGS